MEGAVIARAEVNRPDLRWPLPERMADRLTGKRVTALRRRSKYILADLDSGESLLVHLGMSGRMLISGAQLGTFYHDHPAPQKHDHVVLHMDNGARITFNDARRFGAMDLMPTLGAENHALLAGLGPEPFGNDFHEPYLAGSSKGPKAMPRSRRRFWTSGSSRALAISTSPKHCIARGSVLCVWRATSRRAKRMPLSPPSAMFWPRRSRLVVPVCAISDRPMASLAISPSIFRSMTAKATPARPRAVPVQ